jgi:5-keto 4-deoxyuronate isomerase
VLSIALSAGICTVTLNGSTFSFAATGHRTLAVSAEDGEKPLFYLNGQYAGEGSATVTLATSNAWMLTVGNNTARNNPFSSTLKKLSIYSRVLTPAEIRAAHIMSSAERPFTT